MVKIDLHVHTNHSKCSYSPVKDVILTAKKRGLDGITIADHNTMSAIKEAKKIADDVGLLLIPGQEISTTSGHIVALNIKKPIKKGLSPEETIKRIHKQGGLAVAAHPYAFIFHRQSLRDKVKELDLDAIEAFNSANLIENKKAIQVANELDMVQVAGSDAHILSEIGRAYTIADCNLNVKSFLSKIKNGEVLWVGERTLFIVGIHYKLRRLYSILTNKESLNKRKNR
ncbi:MAG: CehA/McbA family metallohydrolase [Candidatus Woesearchaeota archaeon]|nr:MAG: CehA/McbA family metallohydrolase [Candidatus Woesearchaeota archaeon]